MSANKSQVWHNLQVLKRRLRNSIELIKNYSRQRVDGLLNVIRTNSMITAAHDETMRSTSTSLLFDSNEKFHRFSPELLEAILDNFRRCFETFMKASRQWCWHRSACPSPRSFQSRKAEQQNEKASSNFPHGTAKNIFFVVFRFSFQSRYVQRTETYTTSVFYIKFPRKFQI